MIRNAMRRIYRAIRLDFLPWPTVFPALLLGWIGLDLIFYGTVRVGPAIFGAIGGTLGTMWFRRSHR
jgi:hypothetical protein